MYVLINPVTGQQTSLSEAELTQKLQLNCVLLRDGEHLGIITHRDLVSFARWCAGVTLAQSGHEPDQRVINALVLIDQWLEDEMGVTPEEMEAAASAAWAAETAAWAAARPSSAAWAAASAARAAETAAWAAKAAARTAWDAEVASYEAQAQWLVEHLQTGK